MKTHVKNGNILIDVPTTEEGVRKKYTFNASTAYKWYPFNINYSYKYSNAKGIIYLIKETSYKKEDVYKVSKPSNKMALKIDGESAFLLKVYKRNLYIMNTAYSLGLPIIRKKYTLKDVERGFIKLGDLVDTLRETLGDRLENDHEVYINQNSFLENTDKQIYDVLNQEERKKLQEYGEMYTMLGLMRKIAKDKESS